MESQWTNIKRSGDGYPAKINIYLCNFLIIFTTVKCLSEDFFFTWFHSCEILKPHIHFPFAAVFRYYIVLKLVPKFPEQSAGSIFFIAQSVLEAD